MNTRQQIQRTLHTVFALNGIFKGTVSGADANMNVIAINGRYMEKYGEL